MGSAWLSLNKPGRLLVSWAVHEYQNQPPTAQGCRGLLGQMSRATFWVLLEGDLQPDELAFAETLYTCTKPASPFVRKTSEDRVLSRMWTNTYLRRLKVVPPSSDQAQSKAGSTCCLFPHYTDWL